MKQSTFFATQITQNRIMADIREINEKIERESAFIELLKTKRNDWLFCYYPYDKFLEIELFIKIMELIFILAVNSSLSLL